MTERLVSRSAAALAVAAALAAPGAAAAYAAPLVMGPLYEEPKAEANAAATAAASPSAGGCTVNVLELTDTRRAPETLGMIGLFRAIGAPADRQAWLKSVIDVGLRARGFTPVFVAPGAAEAPDGVNVRISLRTVWIMTMTMNKSGSVVLRMAAGRGAPGASRDYRGDVTSLWWAATAGEFNGAINTTFAEALDGMAADLRPLCAAGHASSTPAAAAG